MNFSSTFTRLVTIWAITILISSCSTERDVQQLELTNAVEAVQDGRRLLQELRATPPDPTQPAFYAFISAKFVNDMLSGLDGLLLHPPGMPDVTVQVRSVRTDFAAGSPVLATSALAREPKHNLSAELAVVARLKLETNPETGKLRARIQLLDIKPKIRWSVFNLSEWRFVRQLAQLQTHYFAAQLPTMEIPVRVQPDLVLPAGAKEAAITTPARGNVSLRLTYPDLRFRKTIAVERVLFFRNGVHVFGKLEE